MVTGSGGAHDHAARRWTISGRPAFGSRRGRRERSRRWVRRRSLARRNLFPDLMAAAIQKTRHRPSGQQRRISSSERGGEGVINVYKLSGAGDNWGVAGAAFLLLKR